MLIETNAKKIDLVIADDYYIYRKGLVSILQNQPQIRITGQAANGKELIELVECKRPNIVLIDLEMPVMNGIEATKIISRDFPEIGLIALSRQDRHPMIIDILDAGAKGYLLKSADQEEVLRAIKAVSEKNTYYANDSISWLMKSVHQSISTAFTTKPKPKLTAKEIIVIKLICNQYSNKEIASKLSTSLRSIESARERIQYKTGSKNVTGIVLYAVEKGIISVGYRPEAFPN